MAIAEEAARALVTLGTLRTQLDVILPYFLAYANAEQRRRWLPGIAAGRILTAIAMTEPGTGSDLAGIQTKAVHDGDHYVLDGARTFITGGLLADLVIVVARTSTDTGNRRSGLSLLVVEDAMPGFSKGRRLEKIGLKVQDAAELSFTAVRVMSAASSRWPTPPGPSSSAPRCRPAPWTGACNCSAETATSSSTRSRACSLTPGSPASTAGPARS
jgi:acyl-CoA dehydrogenase